MSDETKIGEANAGFVPEVVTSKSGRRHLTEESKRRLLEQLSTGNVCVSVPPSQFQRLADLERAVLKAADEWREADTTERAKNHELYGGYSYVTDSQLAEYRLVRDAETRARCALRDAVDSLRRARDGGEG